MIIKKLVRRVLGKKGVFISLDDVTILKKAFLNLHDLYERTKFDLNMAQKCSYYALNVSESNKPSEVVFFCHEIATMYARDFDDYRTSAEFYKMSVRFTMLTVDEDKYDNLVYLTSMIGKSHYFLGEYRKSLKYYQEAKRHIDDTGEGKENLDVILDSIDKCNQKIDNHEEVK